MSARGADIRKPASTKPRRHWLRALAVVTALLIVGIIVIAYFLQPTQLTAILLGRASDALKLDLKTTGPGSYALRPEPRLVLPGLSATLPGDGKPIFRSAQVELALPWSTLRGRGTDISSIVLKSPDIDIAAMQSWLATRPPGNKPFKFPTLTSGLHVDDGVLRGSAWRIEHFDIDIPSLANGRPASLAASGIWMRSSVASKFALRVTSTPTGIGSGFRIDDARIALQADGELPSLTATGNLQANEAFALDLIGVIQHVPSRWADSIDSSFAKPGDTPFSIMVSDGVPASAPASPNSAPPMQDGLHLQLQASLGDAKRQPTFALKGQATSGETLDASLHGQLSRWPDALPGLPSAIASNPSPIVFDASYRGSIFLRDPIVFEVSRADARLQGQARLAELRAWVSKKFDTLLPPIEATLSAPQIDVGGVQLRGVRVDLHDDAPATQPAAKPVLAVPKS